jgi:hypothetical protein
MSSGVLGRARNGRRRAVLGAVALVAAISLSACGSSDFPNRPPPPAAIQVTARIDPEQVEVSPDRFGAGLVNFTIANLSRSPVRFTLSGPKHAATPEIEPETPTSFKVELPEGRYEAAAASDATIRPASVTVGPERRSSQNKLLQP